MSKEKETEEEVQETTEEPVKPVALGQVASQFERVYMTPEGNLTLEEYMVWQGNMLVEIKEALAG